MGEFAGSRDCFAEWREAYTTERPRSDAELAAVDAFIATARSSLAGDPARGWDDDWQGCVRESGRVLHLAAPPGVASDPLRAATERPPGSRNTTWGGATPIIGGGG